MAKPRIKEKIYWLYGLSPEVDLRSPEEIHEWMQFSAASAVEKWEIAEDGKKLLAILESIPVDRLQIENALCLGLGSLQRVIHDDATLDRNPYLSNHQSMYQLLVFEKVLDLLRKTCDIKKVTFQDPAFSPADMMFLEQLGYTVVGYPFKGIFKPGAATSRRIPCDPTILQQASSNTFVFAPYLEPTVLVPLIHAFRPNLYLGTDLVFPMCYLGEADGNELGPILKDYEDFAMSRGWVAVPFLGTGTQQGFHWPGDSSDELFSKEVRDRLQMLEQNRAEEEAQRKDSRSLADRQRWLEEQNEVVKQCRAFRIENHYD